MRVLVHSLKALNKELRKVVTRRANIKERESVDGDACSS
jgi:hypothetical protein